jgi:asparagine synthase (glutamine-hydrolysing)
MDKREVARVCGIVGLIDNVAGHVSPELLATMRDVMIKRGPDGEGTFIEDAVAMAMRRLSIIDLEGGAQPFFSRNGTVVAFQNGEIYNYRTLSRELSSLGRTFKSHSDTEVLAHGYAQWGIEGLLERLDGMYALAILDRDSKELHLARDRFGEKPLFYTSAPGRFAYSSNLLALAALPWVDDSVDPAALYSYLALHYVPGDATIFRSIKRVLPGERVTVSLRVPVPIRNTYYQPSLKSDRKTSDDELSDLIEEAVASRLVADVPVGVFLSGGLDSSLIAAIAAKKHPHIATFSMGFSSSSHDESGHAKAVAQAIGSDHHEFQFDDRSFRELLPKVASELDEPLGDQAMLPLYWLCREARKHVTVALSGEGADEVFAGYSYYPKRLSSSWSGDPVKSSLIQSENCQTPSGYPLLTDPASRFALTGVRTGVNGNWETNLMTWLGQTSDELRRASALDLATWLPDDLLVKFDRMSMSHSLEGRAPYLTPKIVEAGLLLQQSQKVSGSTNKVALRSIASKWLPGEILERPKQGFVLPMGQWLKQWFANEPSVYDYFRNRPFPELNTAEATNLVSKDLRAGIQRERLLFALVILVEWYQAFKSRQYELARKYRAASARLALA